MSYTRSHDLFDNFSQLCASNSSMYSSNENMRLHSMQMICTDFQPILRFSFPLHSLHFMIIFLSKTVLNNFNIFHSKKRSDNYYYKLLV